MNMQAGIWNLDGKPISSRSLGALVNPGSPDQCTMSFIFVDESLGMLYRPDSSPAECPVQPQPYRSPGGAVISWDGRLDNREELIYELPDPLDAASADVVVIAAAFDRWGRACFSKFIGDWAVTVWDRNHRQVVLARDFIGIKHLFYSLGPTAFAWSNDLTCLVNAADHVTLCDQYVAGFLASFPNACLTPYREILSVPPGSFVSVCDGRVQTETYWSFNPLVKTRYRTDREYEEHYRHLFRQAVRRRLRSSFPVLAELSGGFDSSSIVCMADSVLARGEAKAPCLHTISFYDPSEPEDDDFSYFTAVEKERGQVGFHIRLDQASGCIPFTFPMFAARPGLGVNRQLEVALKTILDHHNCRVMLSGSGGDEFNGQALDPRIPMADMLLDCQFLSLAKLLMEWSLLIRKRPWIHLFFQTLLQLIPASMHAGFFAQLKVEPWINSTFAKKHRKAFRQIHASPGKAWIRPSARHAADIVTMRSRQMTNTAPWRVERWYPFLDQDLIAFLTTIPLEQLLRPGERRSLMRRALAGLLPLSVLQRTTKAGLGRCFSIALERHWEALEKTLELPLVSQLGYVEADQLRRSLASLKNGEHPPFVLRLLRVLALELWLRDISARGLISVPARNSGTQHERTGGLGSVA
jgi:asparagine synthase (glutamine-hydrolysing)